MPRSSNYVLLMAISVLVAGASWTALAISQGVTVQVEPAGEDLAISHAEAVEYRGRIYPVAAIMFYNSPECLNYKVAYVGKGTLNLTNLAISSGLVSMESDKGKCILIVNGTKLRGIAYIDDNPLLITLSGDNITLDLNIIISRKSDDIASPTTTYDTKDEPGRESFTMRPTAPLEEKSRDEGGAYTSVNREILAGITLALLLAASVVYEYALGRGAKSPKEWGARNDLRRRPERG